MSRLAASGMSWLAAAASAFQFLTVLPVPVRIDWREEHVRRSVVFYPLVGLVIGLAAAGAGALAERALPPGVAGLLVVGMMTLLSGGLHLDGLMDTADGLFSHRSRERMLEIMKDSRVGAMGVMACVFAVGLKAASVASLLGSGNGVTGEWLPLLAVVPIFSRAYLATAIACWPYARAESGLGSLYRSVRRRHAAAAAAAAVLLAWAAALVFWPAAEAGAAPGSAAGFVAAAALLAYGIGAALSALASRRLGGLTGDVYGALNECVELGLLIVLAGYAHMTG